MAGEVENIAISTQVEVVVALKLELSLAIKPAGNAELSNKEM